MNRQLAVRRIYLDNNASAQPLPEVLDVVSRSMTSDFGNPSSAHSLGERAQDLVNLARQEISQLVGAPPHLITFTSGGTEANNLAIYSSIPEGRSARIITSPIEHSSVLKHCQYLESKGHDVVWLSVNSDGTVNLDELHSLLTVATDLVSLQWVNNETGVIQPIKEIGEICRHGKAVFHCDAAQAIGKLPVDLAQEPIDFVSFTAHKIHGPQGVGALCRASSTVPLRPMLFGGDQEDGSRPGTENVAGIVGFGEAARVRRARLSKWTHTVRRLRDRLVEGLCNSLSDVVVNGCAAPRVCNTANVRFVGIDGHALLARLDQRGVICSQSSACTNRRPEPSYVLRAMGLSEDEAYASVRFSLSELNTDTDIDIALETIVDEVRALRQFSGTSVFAA